MKMAQVGSRVRSGSVVGFRVAVRLEGGGSGRDLRVRARLKLILGEGSVEG